jgi:hypothetical protein
MTTREVPTAVDMLAVDDAHCRPAELSSWG